MSNVKYWPSRRPVHGAIPEALQRAVGEVAYKLDVDSKEGRLGIRVFADLSMEEQERAARQMREWTPMHLVINIECRPTRFDLRALAQAALNGGRDDLAVFLDAVMDLGVLHPAFPPTPEVAFFWAAEVFPSLAPSPLHGDPPEK